MQRLLSDAAWSYAAFAVMAVSGVALNFVIGGHGGSAALGVFNQIYAAYVVLAQLAVFGLHDAVQKYVAATPDPLAQRRLAGVALARVVPLSAALSLCVGLLSGTAGRLVDSDEVGLGLAWAAPGLFLFALNKVLMGTLNGQQRMRAFAVMQILRICVLLGTAVVLVFLERPSHALAASFTAAEVVLILPLLLLVRPLPSRIDPGLLAFGASAMPNALLAESFLRVDILVLSLLVDDGQVGVYSFAAMFAEGLYQVGVTVRTVVNPRLVPLLQESDRTALRSLARRAMALGTAAFLLTALPVLCVFPWLAPLFEPGLVAQSTGVLLVLALGLGLYSPFLPLDFTLLQAGFPGRQSALMTLNIGLNVVANLLLVPERGIVGAAMATALAWALSALTLNLAVWGWLGMKGGYLGRSSV